MTFAANQPAYCRFTAETFTIVSSNGCVATLSDGTTRAVGELTSASPFRRNDESPSEYAERVERAEAEAGSWFSCATKDQAATYNDRMAVAAAYKGAPKWERFREAAKREFERTTLAAAELCNLTFAELMTAGEVSEDLQDRWELLAVAGAMLEAAE